MANRETRRRQKIKNEKKIITSFDNEGVPSVVKVTILVAVILIVFYFLTSYLTGNLKLGGNKATNNNTTDSTPATIQYDEILAGETFNMNYNDYYVLFYDFDDSTGAIYKAMVSNFKTIHTTSKIYTVDLSKSINDTYTGETSNPNADKIEDLKIKGPTLIRIKDGSNVSYTEGKDEIRIALK